MVVYGRLPVLEALSDDRVMVDQVLVSRRARGEHVDDIVRQAGRRGVPLRWVAPEKVTRMSGNGRQDQGVVADVQAPGMRPLADAMPDGPVVLLDGVTNPVNVGMILRTALGFSLAGVVLPRTGSPEVGPLVVKASAGLALRAPVFGCETAAEGVALLRAAGFRVVGLDARGGTALWSAELPPRVAVVLGSESTGLSVEVDELVSIPMANGVESLNVAVAAGAVCAELARRR
jgi:23S rRNA (guanosine2251-2'-O)-methyltransferase